MFRYVLSAASIWFEIWGVVPPWIRVKKFQFLQANFRKISISSGNFTQKNSIFSGKFPKKFRFFRIFFSNFQAKIGYLQLLLDKLFYFSSKVTTFEHTSCT